jgi:LGFP repeat
MKTTIITLIAIVAMAFNSQAGDKIIQKGTEMYSGQTIYSNNRMYRLTMQADGNLVLYKGTQATWASGTYGQTLKKCIFQTDGNLVVYTNGAGWDSKTWDRGDYLALQDDGNMVIYDANRIAIWSTDTWERPTKPDYQLAIEAKYQASGWAGDGHSLNGSIIKTKGNKGYVQYYSFANRKTAIYFFPGRGAFTMDTAEMASYDAAGQDNFAYVTSDPKPCGSGCGYNDIVKTNDNAQGILMGDKFVYGEIYRKYKATGRWNGPLGYPTSSETAGYNNLPDKGRFNFFQNGMIAFSGATGAQALWGKLQKLWEKTDNERGWLGFPKESCKLNAAIQVVNFQHGSIGTGDGCDGYNNGGYYVDVNASTASGKVCY